MDLSATHPWPRAYADARKLEWRWTVDVKAPADRLWPLLADLSRLNRALGLPRMTFIDEDGARIGRARYTGVLHEWTEVPWNWVAGRWYELFRIYRKGAMRALFGVYELEPHDGGTRVHIYYGIVPRSRIFDLGLRASFSAMGRAYRRLLPRVAAELANESAVVPPCLREPVGRVLPGGEPRIAEIEAGLVERGLDRDHVAKIVGWVRSAGDDELSRIRVLERAQAWQIDEDALLRTCLHATRAGLLELSWDVICPHCRGVRGATAALGKLPARGACTACGIDFATDSAESIEITFHAHSSLRPLERPEYCSAEPAHKPHIQAQRAVAPGDTAELAAPATPGRYRMRLRGQLRGAWLEVADGAPAQLDWRASELADARIAPAGTLRVHNDGTEPHTFIVEIARWLEHALRPGRLLSFPEFRDLFSEEYLSADVQLAIGEQTILFTDVVGSTAMYEQQGDPAAFVEVKRHFEEVFAIVAAHRGTVVKTIGDAVMGAFTNPVDAVRAARAIHTAFSRERGGLKLRVSLNTGPCIAVRLNTVIDYFGHSVNVAAKLQSVVEAWQVAIASATYDAPGVAGWLREQGAELEQLSVPVRGLPEPVQARRWTVA